MKEKKLKMRTRDRIMILLVTAVGVAGAGYMIWLQSKVDDWNLDQRPEQQQSQQSSQVNERQDTHSFAVRPAGQPM